ncbi:MAG: hypothetical protein E4H01_01165 [Lysobacterales bacterium]|nr:MAG: hypothetical protein E4H01_01165 [Xanthomonadales bacterium]
MTPEEEVIRAGRAREVLENEMFKEAVADIEQALLTGIRHSAFKDEDLREKLCARYALLHDLIQQLKSHMETGELAQASMRDRLKAVVGF